MTAVSTGGKILLIGEVDEQMRPLVDQLSERQEIITAASLDSALQQFNADELQSVILLRKGCGVSGWLLEAGGILEQLPDGAVLLSPDLQILWCNSRFQQMTGSETSLTGLGFYEALGSPEILGPDFCPFHTALGTKSCARSTLHVGEKSYYAVDAKPVFDEQDNPLYLVVMVRDVSADVLQRQKLNAIYQAGLELGDLTPEEILEMPFSDRIELLKSKILHYTQDLLEFETVEIRLIDKRTKKLEPLLAVGMQPDAAGRALYAEPQGNGVTGFVAATGKSYLCEDTENDPLYLPGAKGARSSLTVPLILHDEVLGTFNVESPRPGAFDDNDLQFLELFSREVAIALNTFDLLAAEKTTTAAESTERILREVATPVDEILNDTAWLLERYIGHDPDVCDRLQHVLQRTRDIKQLIQQVGESLTEPPTLSPPLVPRPVRPALRGKRILVVDNDDAVRQAAHELLERVGVVVETAHNGEEAGLMVRRFPYDAVIADIRLPDMTGYECFLHLHEIKPDLPVILMTGFGYDPTHSIVKARQKGLKSVLYKPFRVEQLFTEIEKTLAGQKQDTDNPHTSPESSGPTD